MAEPASGHLEITADTGETWQVPLAGARMIVGRTEGVGVHLPNASVSRQHAELFPDPFGRWWIRDLGSRNGTHVNGRRIDEHIISNGDQIAIETFRLAVRMAGPSPQRPRSAPSRTVDSEMTLAVSDNPADQVTRLDAMASPKLDAGHLSRLTEFSGQLLSTPDPDERLVALCRLLTSNNFHGNSAIALRVNAADADQPQPDMLCPPQSSKNWRAGEEPYISRTLLRAALQTRAPVVASNTGGGGADAIELSLAGSVMQLAAIACPIVRDADGLDLVYVTFPAEYGTGEWLALAALAAEQYRQAEEVWVNRQVAEEQAVLEKDLARAERIQNGLIPASLRVDGLDIGIGFEPCKWVGGDYVDVIELGEGRVFLTVCDVCGKGLQAAIITASLHAMVHMAVREGRSLPEILSQFNDYLCDMLPDESFVTCIGAFLDVKTGEIELVNAGHPPAMIVGADGKARHLQSSENPPLGYVPFDFTPESTRMTAGEMFSLFTDGLTELEDEQGDMLGIDGTAACLERVYQASPDAGCAVWTEKLTAELDAYQGNAIRPDDRTFMLVRMV